MEVILKLVKKQKKIITRASLIKINMSEVHHHIVKNIYIYTIEYKIIKQENIVVNYCHSFNNFKTWYSKQKYH